MTKSESAKARSHALLETAISFAEIAGIGRIVIVARKPIAWQVLKDHPVTPPILVALHARTREIVPTIEGVEIIPVEMLDASPLEWLELSLRTALKLDLVRRGERLLCLYPLTSPYQLDSMSIIQLKEKAEYVSFQTLDKLSENIPAAVLSAVVDFAMELAREGREGKSIGSIFVVGDTQAVLESSRPMILNPFQGYPDEERMITDPNLSETIKEIAQIDGAFVIRDNGVIVSAGRYLDTPAKGIRLPKGLGSRHMAAAAVSKATEAIAVTVSESTRTVRIFQNGKIVLETKPLRGLWF